MVSHDKLMPNDPIGVRLSIGERGACPIVGTDFVVIGVVGARDGANASLQLMGTEVLGSTTDRPGMEAIALRDGDVVTIDVLAAKEAGGSENLVRRLIESVARKASHSVSSDTTKPFSGWKFHIEHGDQRYCATSEPFDLLQVNIVWRPGDAYISFKVMSISGLPDGCTEGRDWKEGRLTSGESLRIRVDGII